MGISFVAPISLQGLYCHLVFSSTVLSTDVLHLVVAFWPLGEAPPGKSLLPFSLYRRRSLPMKKNGYFQSLCQSRTWWCVSWWAVGGDAHQRRGPRRDAHHFERLQTRRPSLQVQNFELPWLGVYGGTPADCSLLTLFPNTLFLEDSYNRGVQLQILIYMKTTW